MVKIKGGEPGVEAGERFIKSIVNMVCVCPDWECVACFNAPRGCLCMGNHRVICV